MKMHMFKKEAFTIVELLIVVVVIGILASIVIVSYSGISNKAITASLHSDLRNASRILEIDITNNGVYPQTADLANNGMGLKASNQATYEYSRLSNNKYCLSATNRGISYYINSGGALTQGKCPSVTFASTWGSTGNEYAQSVAQLADGGTVLVGSVDTGSDAFIARYDSSGALLWNRTYNGSGLDAAKSVIQTSDGGFAVAGIATGLGSGFDDGFVMKFDNTGSLVWSNVYGASAYDGFNDIKQTSDGGYVMTGYTGRDIFVVKINSSGAFQWSTSWGYVGAWADDMGYKIIQSSDNGYVVVGEMTQNSSSSDRKIVVAKFNSVGTVLWTKLWDPGSNSDSPRAIIESADGGYIVGGATWSFGYGNEDVVLVKYDSNGNQVWDRVWGTASVENISALALASNGDIFAVGRGGSDILIYRFDSNGVMLWNKTWGGNNGNGEHATSLALAADGGLLVSGYSYSFGKGAWDALMVKFANDGSFGGCSGIFSCSSLSFSTQDPVVANTDSPVYSSIVSNTGTVVNINSTFVSSDPLNYYMLVSN